MPDLIWKPFSGKSLRAFSGNLAVGFITELEDNSGHVFDLSSVHTKYITMGSGHVRNETEAKKALQKAWDEWCENANLVKNET